MIFNIFAEVVWVQHESSPAILAASLGENQVAAPNSVEKPTWLISPEQIVSYCDHPWAVARKVAAFNHTEEDLFTEGLSECYHLAGEKAFESHLWHQGVQQEFSEWLSKAVQPAEIELYFAWNADFRSLGLDKPHSVNLSGTVVHDLNGDAVFNPGEPIIPDAKICLNREPFKPLCTFSGPIGEYAFNEIPPGGWHFQINSPSTDRLEEFKYTNQLIEADYPFPESKVNGQTIHERYLNLTEFNPIENEISLRVNEDSEQNIFLMQEWATYFAAQKDAEFFQTEAYYDLDIRKNRTRIYNGKPGPTYDQHDGFDASCPRGTEIVSVAEGRVVAILHNSTVAIRHTNQLISVYGHGDPLVEENQFVPRGYPVALCNNNLTESKPHLHFAVWKSTPWLHQVNYGIPPFADELISDKKWIINQNPLETDHLVYILQGGRGVWTEINQPHLPYVWFPGP